MTWKAAVRNFFGGTSYELAPVVATAEAVSPLVPVSLDGPEPAMAMEELLIRQMRRNEILSDAPVLSANDPALRQATFRDRFVPPVKTVEAENRARLQLLADAPVAARPAPLVASPEIDRAEKLAERVSYQSLVPIRRRAA